MTEAPERVRLHNEEPPAPDLVDAAQFTGLADFCDAEDTPPSAPKVLFVLAADEPLEIDPPHYIARAHEVQGREGNLHSGCPAIIGDACLRGPNAVPSWIAILQLIRLLVCNESVSLCPQGVDLEDVGIAAIVPGINDDLEVIVQLLGDIAP